MKTDNVCWVKIIIFIIALTPLLWFKKGLIITGGDINFPLSPLDEFMHRSQAWDGVYQGGRENVMNFATLIFTGVQALFYLLTKSVLWTEKLSFVFWFMLTAFSIYYLSGVILQSSTNTSKGEKCIARYVICVFYIFNFYQLSTWAGMHIAGITALSIVPFIMGLYIRILNNNLIGKSIVYFSILFVFSAGIIVNPPLFCMVGFLFISYLIWHIYQKCIRREWLTVKINIKQSIFLLILFILLNAYIVLPFIDMLKSSESILRSSNRKDDRIVKYLDFQTEYSSPLNVIRLMGNSELYQKWTKKEYYFPFFEKYVIKRSLMALSFLMPLLAFLGALVNYHMKLARYLLFLSIIGIIFGVGPHPPMEKIYTALMVKVPGFYIFRSPWLKFGFLTNIGYSILAGLFFIKLFGLLYVRKNMVLRICAYVCCISVILIQLFFMSSFALGEMYTPKEKRVDLGPLHVKVPNYIYDASKNFNEQQEDYSIAMLPEEGNNNYEWGYGAIEDVLTKICLKSVLYGEYKDSGGAPPIIKMYHLLINALYNEWTYRCDQILSLMGVRYAVQRNDFRYYFYGDHDSPDFIKDAIAKQDSLTLINTYGKWDVYKNDKWQDDFISANNLQLDIDSDYTGMLPLSELNNYFPSKTIFTTGNNMLDTMINKKLKNGNSIKVGLVGDTGKSNGVLIYNKRTNYLGKINSTITIVTEGIYKVFIKLKPQFKTIFLNSVNNISIAARDLMKAEYKANNVTYKLVNTAGKLILNTRFDGLPCEDEYIQIKIKDLNVDLQKFPRFSIEYLLDDPIVQMIEFVFGIDCDGDNIVDGYIRGLRTNDPCAGSKVYNVNLLDKAKRCFLEQKAYKVILVEIYCHKVWGVDCNVKRLNKNYKFTIKDVRFDKVITKIMSEYYMTNVAYNENNIIIKSKIVDDTTRTLYVPIENTDIFKFPEIKIRYRTKVYGGAEYIKCYVLVKTKHRPYKKSLVFIGRMPITKIYAEYKMNLLNFEEKLKLFSRCDLSGFVLKIEGEKINSDVGKVIKIKDFKNFRSCFTNRWRKEDLDYSFLELGGKNICLNQREAVGLIPKEIIISRKIYLEKGDKKTSLSLDRDNYLKCQWVCVLPEIEDIKNDIKLKYTKKSETRYIIEFDSDHNKPFMLSMKNNYNHKWRAYILRKTEASSRRREKLEIKNHFVINGFGNGWQIDNVMTGDKVIIEYYPRILFITGISISLVSLIVILSIGGIRWLNRV
jgi:hypothetical protein